MNLLDHLIKYGYQNDDAKEAVDAFIEGGFKKVEEKMQWMDDSNDYEHEYVSELVSEIKDWCEKYQIFPTSEVDLTTMKVISK